MSADATSNPVSVASESKSAKKKRGKSDTAAKVANGLPLGKPESTPGEMSEDPMALEAAPNGDTPYESPYIKELQKNIRNVAKKLGAMAKVDVILAEHPDQSLEELVAARKINADQKAQALKKPSLQASLAQLDEQLAQYKKIDAEYQSRTAADRDTLITLHKGELEQLRANAVLEADAGSRETLRRKLLIFSQFLRAAAAKRVNEDEADTEESRAFEGALLLVYGGDDKAVDAAENLIEGVEQAVPSVEGSPLSINYAHIKKAALEYTPFAQDESWTDTVADSAAATQVVEPESAAQLTEGDPTIVNAGMTELGAVAAETNGLHAGEEGITSALQGSAGDDMANKAGGTSWDNAGITSGAEDTLALDDSFEIVPRNPSETETPHEPAMQNSTTSWADETTAEMPIVTQDSTPQPTSNGASAVADDGFHEVERRRGGHRGGRGDGEGRGRGRGRVGFRGDRGGERGRGGGGYRGERRGGGEGRGRGRGAPRAA